MFRSLLRLSVGIIVTVVLTTCASKTGTQPALDASPFPIVEPSPIPIQMSGPTLGSTMLWRDGATLIFIPAGGFRMGGTALDNPERTVDLSAFWIYSTKVTNGQYLQCVQAGQCTRPRDEQSTEQLDDSFFHNRPVTGVDWAQAAGYCQWLGGYLPTEAQWEKAARGPDGNVYPWGDSDPICDLLNFNNCVGRITNSNSFPGGMSFYGALDLTGNVFEWVADWYDPDDYLTAPAEDPTGPDHGQTRSVRGSSFESAPDVVSSAYRSNRSPDEYGSDLGFRCVVEQPKLPAPYCQFTASDTSNAISSFRDNCQIVVEQTAKGCQTGNIKVTGVTLESFNPVSPLSCTKMEDGYIQCGAPRPNESGVVTVCGVCSESETYHGTPVLGCYPFYDSTSANMCEYNAGSTSVQNGCPAGTLLIDAENCGIPASSDNLCLPGTYFDAGAQMCIGSVLEQSCLPGQTFDAEIQCCRVAGSDSFPCQSNEYLAEYFGCLPMPGHENTTSCQTIEVALDFCMCYTFKDAGSCTAAGCKWIWNYKAPPDFGRCDAPD